MKNFVIHIPGACVSTIKYNQDDNFGSNKPSSKLSHVKQSEDRAVGKNLTRHNSNNNCNYPSFPHQVENANTFLPVVAETYVMSENVDQLSVEIDGILTLGNVTKVSAPLSLLSNN